MVEAVRALTAGDGHAQHAAMELLHGTSAPVHGAAAGAASPMMAAVVTMPSAEQLAALAHGGTAGNGAQHDAVVGKVLADALHGGQGHDHGIDAALSAMSGHGAGGNPVLEALASQGSGAVPFMHMGGAGGFAAHQVALTVEMFMHQDAPPPAHG